MTKKVATPKESHPSHCANIKTLNRVIGQLEGVRRMIEERRYCPDILIQTRAARAALKKTELAILRSHMNHCVAEAFREKNGDKSQEKIDEIITILERH